MSMAGPQLLFLVPWQVGRAVFDHPGSSSRQQNDIDAAPHQHFQAMAVPHVELFGLQTRVVHNDATVGHDPVHVEDQEPHFPDFVQKPFLDSLVHFHSSFQSA